ncbi:MAG: heavy metal-binding domain-containing protein [Candidatus Hodarchaeales archaeon]
MPFFKFLASLETAFGGEITAFVSECNKAREESLSRLIDHAVSLGANAILKVDFETSTVMQDTLIFSAYGTAVIIKESGKTTN